MGWSWAAACKAGHIAWLPAQLVLAVLEMSAFVALTLLSGRQERHPTWKSCSSGRRGFLWKHIGISGLIYGWF